MRTAGRRIGTSTATIERMADNLIRQCVRPDALFTATAFERNRKARLKLTRGSPHALLIVLPAELPVHPPAMNDDHFWADSAARTIIALAVVAPTTAQNTAAKFYFRYHAQAFEARVFKKEEEAERWLKDVLGGV
ncbi:MAG: hypothetical protein KF797_02485 [Flavobacteriales bacterium]|nr:hypothetical protein [Flavobacteriales bacterium]